MCDLGTLALAAALTVQPAIGDTALARLRALSARADSLAADVVARQAADHQRVVEQRRPRAISGGHVTAIFWTAVSERDASQVVAKADSIMAAYGVVPADFIARMRPVQMWTTSFDSIAAAAATRGQAAPSFDWLGRGDETDVAAERIANAVGGQYVQAVADSAWRGYLSWQIGMMWRPDIESLWVLNALAGTDLSTGRACLGGDVVGCRRFLGLDDDARPYRDRYSADDIRRRSEGSNFANDPEYRLCLAHDDDACMRFAEAKRSFTVVPAGSELRASLMRALRALHGPAAVQAALRDSSGSLGVRLARASGMDEDAFVREWRTWVLSRGRPQRVTAGAGDLGAAAGSVLLLVLLAMRRGRWN